MTVRLAVCCIAVPFLLWKGAFTSFYVKNCYLPYWNYGSSQRCRQCGSHYRFTCTLCAQDEMHTNNLCWGCTSTLCLLVYQYKIMKGRVATTLLQFPYNSKPVLLRSAKSGNGGQARDTSQKACYCKVSNRSECETMWNSTQRWPGSSICWQQHLVVRGRVLSISVNQKLKYCSSELGICPGKHVQCIMLDKS